MQHSALPAFYPEPLHVADLVVVKILHIDTYSAHCILLEHQNRPARIYYSEISNRKFTGALSKLLKVQSLEVCTVLSIDDASRVILSRKRVSSEAHREAFKRFRKSKLLLEIMKHFLAALDVQHSPSFSPSLELFYKHIVHFCSEHFGAHKHCCDTFRDALKDRSAKERLLNTLFDASRTCWRNVHPSDLESLKLLLFCSIQKKLKIHPLKVRAHIELAVYSENGIDALKKALLAGRNSAPPDEALIHINLISHPVFSLTCKAADLHSGKLLLFNAMKAIKKSIAEQSEAKFRCIMPPNRVDARTENSLAILMKQIEAENKEVDGDNDFEEGLQFDIG